MKELWSRVFVIFVTVVASITCMIGQDDAVFAYEVNRVYPPISLTQEAFDDVRTIEDLNQYYKPSWIREFKSVQVTTTHAGVTKTSVSADDTFTAEQIDNIKASDRGVDIEVVIDYIPENTLRHNDPKTYDFKFIIDPESDAKFPGGEEEMKSYLESSAIAVLPAGSFVDYDFVAITFTVNDEGQVVDPEVVTSSEEASIDALFIEAINKMPCWTPAEHVTGLKVPQQYALTVGNMANCMVNTINIRRE